MNTAASIAARWSVSEDTVRAIFRREPGVLRIGAAGTRKPAYRIPDEVLERVERRMAVVGSERPKVERRRPVRRAVVERAEGGWRAGL